MFDTSVSMASDFLEYFIKDLYLYLMFMY
jgi:predicted GTPase